MANENEVKEAEATTEEAVAAVPETEEFNPSSFMDGLHDVSSSKTEESGDEPISDAVEENVEEREEEVPAPADDTNTPELQSDEMPLWEKLAKDLNVEADSYDSLVESIKNSNTKEIVIKEDETLQKINNLLNLGDYELVNTWISTRPDYTEEEINERLEAWQNTGELVHQAKNVKLQLENRKKEHLESIKNKKSSEEAKQREATELHKEIK